MTAKEYKAHFDAFIAATKRFGVDVDGMQFEFNTFCDQLCKEQREICASNMLDLSGNVRADRAEFLVNNAPMPEL